MEALTEIDLKIILKGLGKLPIEEAMITYKKVYDSLVKLQVEKQKKNEVH